MARLGFRKFDEMIGRTDLLEMDSAIQHWKARGLDFSKILFQPETQPGVARYNCQKQDLSGDIGPQVMDRTLIADAAPALDRKTPVELFYLIQNTDRAVGAMLSHAISEKYGEEGLPEDTIHVTFKGSAGQSFGAFLAPGITFYLYGDANDYVGKGLSGGRVIVRPALDSPLVPEENILIGNVVLYGAISGQAYFRGLAGERFAVRNSGAYAVVEGVGDHGCEYMTGGRVVVLGKTGRNFAAGMSGGIAYVLDEDGRFPVLCNKGLVDLVELDEEEDVPLVQEMIREHVRYTGSTVGQRVLNEWEGLRERFVKVYPRDYRRVLEAQRKQKHWEAVEAE